MTGFIGDVNCEAFYIKRAKFLISARISFFCLLFRNLNTESFLLNDCFLQNEVKSFNRLDRPKLTNSQFLFCHSKIKSLGRQFTMHLRLATRPTSPSRILVASFKLFEKFRRRMLTLC